LSAFCGGANGDFGLSGWKPRNKNVRTKFGRSKRSFRMHSTTASTSNFSSANSNNVMNDCLDASGRRTVGNAMYNVLLSGFNTVSQTLNMVSVTLSLMVILIGFFWWRIFFHFKWCFIGDVCFFGYIISWWKINVRELGWSGRVHWSFAIVVVC